MLPGGLALAQLREEGRARGEGRRRRRGLAELCLAAGRESMMAARKMAKTAPPALARPR